MLLNYLQLSSYMNRVEAQSTRHRVHMVNRQKQLLVVRELRDWVLGVLDLFRGYITVIMPEPLFSSHSNVRIDYASAA